MCVYLFCYLQRIETKIKRVRFWNCNGKFTFYLYLLSISFACIFLNPNLPQLPSRTGSTFSTANVLSGYIHAYIPTCLPYLPNCLPAYLPTYLPTYIYTYIRDRALQSLVEHIIWKFQMASPWKLYTEITHFLWRPRRVVWVIYLYITTHKVELLCERHFCLWCQAAKISSMDRSIIKQTIPNNL